MPEWFDQEVSDLERRSQARRGERDLVLFYGSSSFTLWHDIEAHFPGFNVLNHGFGGSTLADCVEYFDRLVGAFAPKVIVLYAGDNDLGNGGSPEDVLQSLQRFVARKRETLGEIPTAYVSIKVSPARFGNMHSIAWANVIIERYLAQLRDVAFVDMTRRMIGGGVGALLNFYTHDPLHMNSRGYRVLGKSIWDYLVCVEERAGLTRRVSCAAPAWAQGGEAIVLQVEAAERESAL